MKVLVSGGCGYIGSHVARQLLEAGNTVDIVDNLSTGFLENLVTGITFYNGDVINLKSIDQLFEKNKYDAVLHFAASIAVGESVEKPLEYYNNNVTGTINLLKCCLKYNVQKFIFSSTAAVYAESSTPVSENSPKNPSNPYGWSKLFSEQIIQDVTKTSPLRYVILRYFNVAGANPQGHMGQRVENATHLIKAALQASLGKHKDIHIFGTDYPTPDGTGVRDYIHVEDLANAHVLALDYLNQSSNNPSEIFNVGYGQGFSVREVLSTVQQVTEKPLEIIEAPRRPGDTVSLVADASKLQKKLNWQPQYNDLPTIIKHAWMWEQKLFAENS